MLHDSPSRALALPASQWALDSGATAHITPQRGAFISYEPYASTVSTAAGAELKVEGKGTVQISYRGKDITISNVLYVPLLAVNLISINQLSKRGIHCLFKEEGAEIIREGRVIATVPKHGDSYILQGKTEAAFAANTNATLWHNRLGHLSTQRLQRLAQVSEGLNASIEGVSECEVCQLNKSSNTISRTPSKPATQLLGRVHTDFWGPFRTPTPSGNRLFLSFTDDFSRKSWVYLLQKRSQLYEVFRGFKQEVEQESAHRIQHLRCDNAKEYKALAEQWQSEGVVFEFTTPYTPSQNGISERLNRTLTAHVRCLLGHANLPVKFWGEALHTAYYLRNRLPTCGNGDRTPEEL